VNCINRAKPFRSIGNQIFLHTLCAFPHNPSGFLRKITQPLRWTSYCPWSPSKIALALLRLLTYRSVSEQDPEINQSPTERSAFPTSITVFQLFRSHQRLDNLGCYSAGTLSSPSLKKAWGHQPEVTASLPLSPKFCNSYQRILAIAKFMPLSFVRLPPFREWVLSFYEDKNFLARSKAFPLDDRWQMRLPNTSSVLRPHASGPGVRDHLPHFRAFTFRTLFLAGIFIVFFSYVLQGNFNVLVEQKETFRYSLEISSICDFVGTCPIEESHFDFSA